MKTAIPAAITIATPITTNFGLFDLFILGFLSCFIFLTSFQALLAMRDINYQ